MSTRDVRRDAAGWVVVCAMLLCASARASDQVSLQPVNRDQFRQLVSKHQGQVVLVDFWATWCAPCKELFSKTVDLAKAHRDDGLVVISVSFDEPEDQQQALDFLKSKGATITNLISTDGFDSIETFQIDNGAIPHYQLYDRDGKLVKKFVSGDPDNVFDEDDVREAVRELLQQGKP